ncbi:MAG: D-alanyl-D-alanine carboxypeptidase [Oscillospiraceae bacterium]|nr:D-alanyl-D-alanine carboxypeptidase [Oscillospiraceae bacterium]
MLGKKYPHRFIKGLVSAIAVLLLLHGSSSIYIAKESEIPATEAKATPQAQTSDSTLPVEIAAKAAVLMDAGTGKLLVNYNPDARLFPASVTKIMPLLLVGEAIDSGKIKLSDPVTVSAAAAGKGGSQIWLKEGETMTVEELVKATAIYSANDACTALGEFLAGSEEGIVKMMNDRAKELGMRNTTFVNCTGLDDDTTEHLTTARDIAIMSRELLKHDSVIRFSSIWMDSLRDGKTELVNTNRLVRFYEGATGLKTGTTSKAGCCISASALREGTHLVAVVLGSESSNDRFDTAKRLLNWGFANYASVVPEIDPAAFAQVRVLRGAQRWIVPELPEAIRILVPKGSEKDLQQQIDLPLDVQAPVEAGQTLGKISILLDGEVLGSFPLKAAASVAKLDFKTALLRALCALVG